MTRRPILASVTAAAVVLSTAMLAAPATAAPPPDIPSPSKLSHVSPALRDKVAKDAAKVTDLLDATGNVTAFVQLKSPAGVDVAKKAGTDDADVKAAAKDTKALAADVVPSTLTEANADTSGLKRIGTLTNLVSATLVTGDASKIRALASNPDVVAIYRVARKKLENANSDAFTKALATWKETGNTGYGVRIGIIDTGLDYTHADFGGPGTVAAYNAAYGTDGTGPILAGSFDRTKFIGGYDFAGPKYNADPAAATYDPVPHPDANPIDSLATSANSGHGTHVAGSAAGYGVDGDGKTFTGDYSAIDSLAGWEIGPGTAPEAQLFSLKVFGDVGGSTDVTALALDRAADPNNDGDFSDRLDVVNLSLGSDGSPADDPDNIVIDKLSALGTVVAIASGNAGDITDIGGGPGNAASALTVANSVAAPVLDAVEVTAAGDDSLVGEKFGAQNSIAYTGTADVTAPVWYSGDAKFDGCTAFTNDQKTAVAGKIAYLWWDDNDATRACGSAVRFGNAAAAGAAGVVLPTEVPVFVAGISGVASIPGAQLIASATDELLPEIMAGTLSLHIGPSLAMQGSQDGAGDLLNGSSSRGVHGSLGVIKPDVAAPGTGISSAASGEGDAPHVLSGTSMATPHVAGIAALVVRAHPAWSSSQVKAAVMNTATHDVTTKPDGGGLKYGPQRVGSGRVDALDAVNAKVIAYNKAKPALTSVTFGVVKVGASKVVQKQVVTVKNFDTLNAKTYATSVSLATKSGGATITASPASITVPKGGSVDVTLTLTADPATLKKEIDPTSSDTVSGLGREFVSEVAGRLVLKPATGTELRVPVQAAPKLVSALTASAPVFDSAAAGFGEIPVTGRAVTKGGFDSISAGLILAATSPKIAVNPALRTSPSALASGDIKYVGWSSTVPFVKAYNATGPTKPIDPVLNNKLEVGLAVYGDWASLGRVTIPVIYIDINKDGTPDIEADVVKLNDDSDLTVVATYDLKTNKNVGLELVNEQAGDVDSGIFDNSVLVAPINLADNGIKAGDKPSITVSTYSSYAAAEDGEVDTTPAFTVDPFAPPFWFAADDLVNTWIDGDVNSILTYKAAGVTSGKLLVLTPQNSDPSTRAQVVDIKTTSSTKLAISPTSVKFGTAAKATATVTGSAAPTGKVEFREGAKVLATANLSVSGKVGKATVTLPKSLKVGKHTLTAVYLGSTGVATSKGTATLTVAKAKPKVSLSTSSWTVKKNSTPKLTVSVKGSSGAPAPTGKVVVKVGSKSVSATLSSGKVTVRLPKVTKATTVSVTYKGSSSYSSATATHKLKLK
ncbi:S8 family serine peptidase [Cellulomonas sp. PhB150]|uniref:S8 family serine peptidase n=1 Tax=Cellulomonas sp. PhB150 TaxID=2485188 RepID=UPI000F47E7D5|nr:S8 family serine peptidase [Cellulomonas sp. PhB150]ROS25929.1 Ig-like domain-containing protein [Cellulomonas sp. PhB150]